MSWIITGSEKYETDPYRSQVSLLLHGDGANGSTTITDSSPSPKTVLPLYNAQISTAIADPFGNNTGVIAFDNVQDYLVLPTSIDFALGDTWTVEAWMYCNVVGSGVNRNALLALLASTGFLHIYVETGGNFTVRAGNVGSDVVAAGAVIAQEWQFWAVSCASNVATIYLNGQSVASGPVSGSVSAQSGRVGTVSGFNYSLDGYIDDLRITKGVARYTANFTPPTAPFPDI